MDKAASILTQAIGLQGVELEQFLDRACGSDGELRRQVETLLSEAGDAEDFFDGLSVGLPVLDVPEDPLIPATDRYQAEGIVGRGGMGVVAQSLAKTRIQSGHFPSPSHDAPQKEKQSQ